MKPPIILDHTSFQPKYQQIINAVVHLLEEGRLKKGDSLPSINELALSQKIAKVTVARAYRILKDQGLVLSRQGKGFYVASTGIEHSLNIFLLFDTLNANKEILYDSFQASLPAKSRISLFFHHYDLHLFENLLQTHLGNFDYYILMPHFNVELKHVVEAIPKNKLILLDKNIDSLQGSRMAVFQDFEADITAALISSEDLLKKYSKLTLIKSEAPFQFIPDGILRGFEQFSKAGFIPCETAEKFTPDLVREGEAYLVFADKDLINLIKTAQRLDLRLGKDIGLISYDDTPMKEILEGGITVISTDFEQMGKTAAAFVSHKKTGEVVNPSKLIIRESL